MMQAFFFLIYNDASIYMKERLICVALRTSLSRKSNDEKKNYILIDGCIIIYIIYCYVNQNCQPWQFIKLCPIEKVNVHILVKILNLHYYHETRKHLPEYQFMNWNRAALSISYFWAVLSRSFWLYCVPIFKLGFQNQIEYTSLKEVDMVQFDWILNYFG